MNNEFGNQLDGNGSAPSIIIHPFNSDRECHVCGVGGDLARHEVFPGPYRQKSKKYGLWVNLCPACHTMAHSSREEAAVLKRRAQKAAMEAYGWSTAEFRKRFGKNYL